MTDIISKTMHKAMNENIVEIYGFMQSVKHPLYNELLTLLDTEESIQSLEILLVKITQTFSICAFLQTNDLENLRPTISKICDNNVLYKEFLCIYDQAVSLKDINENLTDDEYKLAKERLEKFIYSFYNQSTCNFCTSNKTF